MADKYTFEQMIEMTDFSSMMATSKSGPPPSNNSEKTGNSITASASLNASGSVQPHKNIAPARGGFRLEIARRIAVAVKDGETPLDLLPEPHTDGWNDVLKQMAGPNDNDLAHTKYYEQLETAYHKQKKELGR